MGTLVRTRSTTGRITSVTKYEDCTAVGLGRVSASTAPLVLLEPFDRLQPVSQGLRWRRGRLDQVAAAAAGLALETAGLGKVGGAAVRCRDLRLLDWQLEPGLALRRGRAARVLVADAVGLGKTVQAGLATTLLCDSQVDRALILTPAGLRDQWRAELERLFGIRASVIDAAALRHLRRTLPDLVNPWSLPGVHISAIDFVKQPEILAGVLQTRWTLVVLDEAHGLTAATDRRRAGHLVAQTADYVMLLTATPHSGQPEALDDLCRIGGTPGERLPIFRRSRADVHVTGVRRFRALLVRPTAAEQTLHDQLRAYLRRLRRERLLNAESAALLSAVLVKRAASSAEALRRTLVRRRGALADTTPVPVQHVLPFDAGEHDDEDATVPDIVFVPAWHDRRTELDTLDALITRAGEAAARESKLQAVLRLLRRVQEPVLVFTEYRDTLQRLASLLPPHEISVRLHGGLNRAERRQAVAAFTSGAARLLLATDAAGEGLNLHQTCRMVVNLDIPWNPQRLEQRIGRVDRIGQHRPVHAIVLVGRTRLEATLVRRLRTKLDRVHADLSRAPGPPDATDGEPVAAVAVSLLRTCVRRSAGTQPAGHLPWALVRPSTWRRLGLHSGVLVFCAAHAMCGTGAVAAAAGVPVLLSLAPDVLVGARMTSLVRACATLARDAAKRDARARLARGLEAHAARIERRRLRLQAALDAASAAPAAFQPGLFDRRALTAALRQRSTEQGRLEALRRTLDGLSAESQIDSIDVRPIAALVLR